ncbi:MAG TPA: tetratricopeptide repeat protein [bacterium]|nr:tetratricopeptide repeat protein [bacterium]
MKTWGRISPLAGIAVLGVFLIGGCASTGRQSYQPPDQYEDMADIDALLGLGDASDDMIGEDDVLRLLGLTTERPTERTVKSAAESGSDISSSDPAGYPQTSFQPESQPSAQPSPGDLAYREPDRTPPSQAAPPRTATAATFEQRYEEARRAYNARNFQSAIQQFEALLSENRSHALSDNCQYWIGEAYYGMGNYQRAIAAFEKVFTFPRSNKYPDSQLKLGLSYLRMNNTSRAAEELQKLIDNYPTSEYVSAARQYLARLKTDGTS